MDKFAAPAASGSVVLSPAGPSGWRAIDSSYPLTDARCLLAYVEAVADHYLVLSLVPSLGGVTEVGTLAEAVTMIQQRRTRAAGAATSSGTAAVVVRE